MSRTAKPDAKRTPRKSRSNRVCAYFMRQIFKRCHYCHGRTLAYCDHRDEAGENCAKPICLEHAKARAGQFFCPDHAEP